MLPFSRQRWWRRLLAYPLLFGLLYLLFAWLQHDFNFSAIFDHDLAYFRPALTMAGLVTLLTLLNDLILFPVLWRPGRYLYFVLAAVGLVWLASRVPLNQDCSCGALPLNGWPLFAFSALSIAILGFFHPAAGLSWVGERRLLHMDAELRDLRDQVNPHFLFNTLNSIYALARERSEQTPDVVHQLANLLRYQLETNKVEAVPLPKELGFIEDYLLLEDTRLGDRCQISFSREGPAGNYRIYPMLLLPFVENAFKHGANASRAQSWIRVGATLKGQWLTFRVDNSRGAARSGGTTGTGLANVRRRLELLYPRRHHLRLVTDRPDQYSVTLTLQLDAA